MESKGRIYWLSFFFLVNNQKRNESYVKIFSSERSVTHRQNQHKFSFIQEKQLLFQKKIKQ